MSEPPAPMASATPSATPSAAPDLPPLPGSAPGASPSGPPDLARHGTARYGTARRAPAAGLPRVTGLNCPRCGGAVTVAPGLKVLECPFCSASLLVHSAGGSVAGRSASGVARYAVMPRLDAGEARRRVFGWLAQGFRKHGRLSKEALPEETVLCFLPFFRVRADLLAVALGRESYRDSDNKRRTRPVERTLERSLDTTYPAVAMAEWGVERVDLSGDELVPFDGEALSRMGLVFPPGLSESEILDLALTRFQEEADPGEGLDQVHFRWATTLRSRLEVIYYPLWLVRYRFRERIYHVLIDGEDGSLSHGKAPGNDLWRAGCLVAAQVAACYLFTTVVRSGLFWSDSDDTLSLLTILGMACLMILYAGWRQFRWGGEVVEGYGAVPSRRRKGPKKGQSPLPWLGRRLGLGSSARAGGQDDQVSRLITRVLES